MTAFKYFSSANVACETNWYFIDILISISIIMSIFSCVYTPFEFSVNHFFFYFIFLVLVAFGLKEELIILRKLVFV